MKAKQVYEFIQSKSLKKSVGNTISIKYKRIIDWFKEYYPDWDLNDEFKINDDLSVYVSKNMQFSNFTWIPFDKIDIDGFAELRSSKIYPKYIELSGPLYFNKYQALDLSSIEYLRTSSLFYDGYNISALPQVIELYEGYITLKDSNIKQLPNKFYGLNKNYILEEGLLKSLELNTIRIKELIYPKLNIINKLIITNLNELIKIKINNCIINKDLEINYCKNLESISGNYKIYGDLVINNCENLKKLNGTFNAESAYIYETSLSEEEIREKIKVKKYLRIN